MNFKNALRLIFLSSIFFTQNISAQGGGPPMLTDDPMTPEKNHFEINSSFTGEFSKQFQFGAPLIDISYGATSHLQLKAEMPFEISIDENKSHSSGFGAPNIGFKYRFMDEEKFHVAVSVFPQMVFDSLKEILVPFQFQKTIGKFTLGEALGYFFVEDDSHNFLSGTLVGYQFSDNAEMMLEFYLEHNFIPLNETDAFINYGFRYHFSDTFTLITSFGTQVIAPSSEEKQNLISFLGLQTLF